MRRCWDTLPTSGILLPTRCEQLHWIHIIIFRTKKTLLPKTTKSRSNARICGSDARMSRWPGHLSRECREMLSPILPMFYLRFIVHGLASEMSVLCMLQNKTAFLLSAIQSQHRSWHLPRVLPFA